MSRNGNMKKAKKNQIVNYPTFSKMPINCQKHTVSFAFLYVGKQSKSKLTKTVEKKSDKKSKRSYDQLSMYVVNI